MSDLERFGLCDFCVVLDVLACFERWCRRVDLNVVSAECVWVRNVSADGSSLTYHRLNIHLEIKLVRADY